MIKERLISALIGTLLILAFQPFGLHAFGWMRWLLMLGIAVCVTVSCLASEYVLRYILRMPNNPEAGMNYNIRRNFAYQAVNILLLTTTVSLFLDQFACNDKVDNHLSLSNIMIVFGSFVGASAIIGLYWKNVYWKRHYMRELADSQRLNGILEERRRNSKESNKPDIPTPSDIKEEQPVPNQSENKQDTPTEKKQDKPTEDKQDKPAENGNTVLLEGTTKEHLCLNPTDFLYAESDGNYVTVHYLNDTTVKKSVLRISIKNIAMSLCGQNGIIQCHRAFIVNLSHVVRVESRSSGIGLKLKGVVDIIPVSKSYVAEVKRLIQNPE